MQFGRCPVRHLFQEVIDHSSRFRSSNADYCNKALAVLQEHKDDFDGFVSHKMPLTDAVKAYELFEARKVQKVVFTMP